MITRSAVLYCRKLGMKNRMHLATTLALGPILH